MTSENCVQQKAVKLQQEIWVGIDLYGVIKTGQVYINDQKRKTIVDFVTKSVFFCGRRLGFEACCLIRSVKRFDEFQENK